MNFFGDIKKNQNKNFNYLIDNIDYQDIDFLVDRLIEYKDNNIFLIGVGKSGNFAIHLSDLLKSVSLKSFYLNSMNITHGDLGCIDQNDLVIFFSKSGNTKEILDIVNLFKCFKILVCCNEKSKIKSIVDKTIVVPLEEEGDIKFGLIPTNSMVNNIVYFNFVINLYIKKSNLELNEYKNNHPSGDIGFKTKKVIDFVTNDIIVINNINLSLKEITKILNNNKLGIICTDIQEFYGILTSKDLINIYSKTEDINSILQKEIKSFINTSPIVIENSSALISEKIEIIKNYKYFKLIPVINDKKYIGIIDNSKILKYL